MLRKKVAGIITATTRTCKCGHTITINPIDKKTICDKCGEIVHEESKNSETDSKSE